VNVNSATFPQQWSSPAFPSQAQPGRSFLSATMPMHQYRVLMAAEESERELLDALIAQAEAG